MKRLVKVDRHIPWMPDNSEGRLYITDELPSLEICGTAFGFAFEGNKILLTRLTNRDWDIPGGRIESGETPEEAAIREVWEETYAKVEIIDLIGIQELEIFSPKQDGYRWNYPLNVQVYYRCRVKELHPFEANQESFERSFFTPDDARFLPTMTNHSFIYEEALRRAAKP